jgi:Lrp/AsnC family transcriptional regulator, leucine-responsive regulatory protein
MTHDLDAADRALLRAVQEDARQSMEALGRTANISASTAQRRLQRLRDIGVITGEVAIVAPKAVGQGVSMLVALELEQDRPELLPALHRWISHSAQIQSAWYVTGQGDITLVVTAADIEAFDAFMVRFLTENRSIRRFTTSVVLRTLKRGSAVAIDAT